MSEIGNYLRLLVNGDKTAKITVLKVVTAPQEFTTSFNTSLNYRKKLFAYNNSPSASGELYMGFSGDLSPASGYPIPSGAEIKIPVAQNISIFFCSTSGEVGDMRIFEIA